MSVLLHSDSETTSDDSMAASLAGPDLDPPAEDKVPVSMSVLLENTHVSPPRAPPAKVTVRFLAIGSTAAMHPSAFTVAGTQTVATILKFLMKKLGLKCVYMYVLNSFQPTPDESIGQLHAMFHTNGVLNFSYCENIAFG